MTRGSPWLLLFAHRVSLGVNTPLSLAAPCLHLIGPGWPVFDWPVCLGGTRFLMPVHLLCIEQQIQMSARRTSAMRVTAGALPALALQGAHVTPSLRVATNLPARDARAKRQSSSRYAGVDPQPRVCVDELPLAHSPTSPLLLQSEVFHHDSRPLPRQHEEAKEVEEVDDTDEFSLQCEPSSIDLTRQQSSVDPMSFGLFDETSRDSADTVDLHLSGPASPAEILSDFGDDENDENEDINQLGSTSSLATIDTVFESRVDQRERGARINFQKARQAREKARPYTAPSTRVLRASRPRVRPHTAIPYQSPLEGLSVELGVLTLTHESTDPTRELEAIFRLSAFPIPE
eukprot:m.410069 g.410069  ORF g.410069 m.410069 type:complete len:346 (+) comp56529_c0_seq2:753-1790(+)